MLFCFKLNTTTVCQHYLSDNHACAQKNHLMICSLRYYSSLKFMQIKSFLKMNTSVKISCDIIDYYKNNNKNKNFFKNICRFFKKYPGWISPDASHKIRPVAKI